MRDPIDDFSDPDDDNPADEELLENDDEEFAIIGGGGTAADQKFDAIVGALEDILLDSDFTTMQSAFLSEYCRHFDDAEENKLIYTQLFSEYDTLVEGFLEKRLSDTVSDFSMVEFMDMLKTRGDEELNSDVVDMLLALGDFGAFKELMLAHKQSFDTREPLALVVTKVGIPGATTASSMSMDGPPRHGEAVVAAEPCAEMAATSAAASGRPIDAEEDGTRSLPSSAPVASKR